MQVFARKIVSHVHTSIKYNTCDQCDQPHHLKTLAILKGFI